MNAFDWMFVGVLFVLVQMKLSDIHDDVGENVEKLDNLTKLVEMQCGG